MQHVPTAESYEQVRYPPVVHPQTHPDRLHVLATLFGLRPAPVEQCRVLELGCGDGSNLAAVAFAHPRSECVGLDTSEAAVADGQALAAQVGLRNVSLRRMDVMDVSPQLGEFDYVIAHGLYSWVPPAVRDKVLAVCRQNLSPRGVAYVSYNVYPAGHFRQMLRGMMRYHADRFADPAERIGQAKELLRFLAEAPPPPRRDDEDAAASAAALPTRHELFRQLIRVELDRLSRVPDGIFFHDELASFNEPLYFHEFAARAAAAGLQYLSEADLFETQPPVPGAPTPLPAEVLRVLEQIPGGDVVAREQYADFWKCRQFRQTLLCHAEAAVQRPAAPARVKTLFAATSASPASANPDLTAGVVERFATPGGGGAISTASPVVKAALLELAAAHPRRLHFDALLERVRARTATGATEQAAADGLAELLLSGYAANILSLHAHGPAFALTPGDRPTASALARAQSARGPVVTNLLSAPLHLSGPIAPLLVRLLDGTRDREALAKDLAAACQKAGVAFEKQGRPLTDAAAMAAVLRAELDDKLADLARLGLLVG